MCGPTSEEKTTAAQTSSISNEMAANYAQLFREQQGVLTSLNNLLTPIAQAGPDQQGFGPKELAALNTQAGETVGQNYNKASQALNTQLASAGGGNEFLPTGAAASLKGNLAQAAANEASNASIGITEANYATGRQNWQNATSGLQQLAQGYSPNAAGSSAISGFGSAAQQYGQIAQQKSQAASAIGGLFQAGLGALGGGIGNLDTTGGSSPFEQFGNFLTGAV